MSARSARHLTRFRTYFPQPGTQPAQLTVPEESKDAPPPVLEVIEYNAKEERAAKLKKIEDAFGCRDSGKVAWINIEGLNDVPMFKRMAEHFHIHPLALEDVFHTGQRPKVEDYAGHLFIVTQMVYFDEARGELHAEQVSIFLGKSTVISIQEEATKDVFDPVRQRILGGNQQIRGQGADYLAYALLDAVADHLFPLLEEVGEDLEEIEDRLLTHPTKQCLNELHQIKRMLLLVRRSAWPQRELISALMRDESGLITPQTKVYLRDCYDHLVQVMDIIENYREMAASLMEIYLSSISIRTNEIMRVLTVISSIFIPLTFIAGVYGMNFDKDAGPWSMPELKSPWGYAICWAVMFCIAGGQLFYFWRRGWLKSAEGGAADPVPLVDEKAAKNSGRSSGSTPRGDA